MIEKTLKTRYLHKILVTFISTIKLCEFLALCITTFLHYNGIKSLG